MGQIRRRDGAGPVRDESGGRSSSWSRTGTGSWKQDHRPEPKARWGVMEGAIGVIGTDGEA